MRPMSASGHLRPTLAAPCHRRHCPRLRWEDHAAAWFEAFVQTAARPVPKLLPIVDTGLAATDLDNRPFGACSQPGFTNLVWLYGLKRAAQLCATQLPRP